MKKPYVTLINGKPPTLESLTEVMSGWQRSGSD